MRACSTVRLKRGNWGGGGEHIHGWMDRLKDYREEEKNKGTQDELKISHHGFEGREMDECCFSGDGDRGRITEDRSGQMDEEMDEEEGEEGCRLSSAPQM